jgi:outer membrane murein-binding lipoprotein Lpp
MSYPGDPSGGQQQPSYPYSDGSGYPPPQQPGYGPPAQQPGYGSPPQGPADPQSGPPAAAPFPPPGQAPTYGSDPGPYGGYYDPNTPPVSSPPTSGSPTYTAQLAGPPAGAPGGPPMMAPMSGPPGAPTSGFGAGPPARRSPVMAIAASAAVFFLLATAVLTVLYITRNGDYNEQKRTVAQRDQNIQSLSAEVDKLKNDLKRVETERDTAKRDLGGAQGQADELKRQKQVISRCINLLGEAGAAARRGDSATADAKSKEADQVCPEAFRYLDD